MAATSHGAPATRPPLRRLPDEGHAAGVCAGIAAHLGQNVFHVQVAFMVLAAVGGVGIAIYALCWALVPVEHGPAPAGDPWHDGRLARQAAGIALLGLAGLLALRQTGLWAGDELVWPLVLGAVGVALIWRQGDGGAAWSPAELRHPVRGLRDRMSGERGADGRQTVAGVALVLLAAYLLLSSTGTLRAVGNAIGGIVVLAGAGALVLGPWLVRLARSLADERAERIRSQERADVAAHLHDSVLQTLALIQKRAEDPREVAALARRQERELRRWLSDRPAPPAGESLAAALEEAAAEVEELHGVPVEVVTVGDCPLDAPLAALVAAAREAAANAAKFSGSAKVDVFAEVGEARVEAFVRDRGAGFDLAAVPDDRRGVRESILGRMERHGGRAAVHTAPGRGTEVELVVERRGTAEAAPGDGAAGPAAGDRPAAGTEAAP